MISQFKEVVVEVVVASNKIETKDKVMSSKRVEVTAILDVVVVVVADVAAVEE